MTGIPIYLPDAVEHRKLLARNLEAVLEGHLRATGTFTLDANETTTTVPERRAGITSVVLWMPLTASAAAATLHVSARGKQTFTLTHDSTADADRDFAYVIIS